MGTLLGSCAFLNEEKEYETTVKAESKCLLFRIPVQVVARLLSSAKSPSFESNLYKARIESQLPLCANFRNIRGMSDNLGFIKDSPLSTFGPGESFFSPSQFFLISGQLRMTIIEHNPSKSELSLSQAFDREAPISPFKEAGPKTSMQLVSNQHLRKSRFYRHRQFEWEDQLGTSLDIEIGGRAKLSGAQGESDQI